MKISSSSSSSIGGGGKGPLAQSQPNLSHAIRHGTETIVRATISEQMRISLGKKENEIERDSIFETD